MRKFLLKGSLAALAIIIYGCNFDGSNEFIPPKKTQVEKQYITQEKEKVILAKASEAVTIIKIKISETAAKYRNINEVVINGVNATGFLTNINFVTRWNILGPFPYKEEKLADNKIKSVLHDKLIANENHILRNRY